MKSLGNIAYNADLATKEYVDNADTQAMTNARTLASEEATRAITEAETNLNSQLDIIKANYATTADVDTKINAILQNVASTRTFTLNAALVGSTNNLKTWEGLTTDITTSELTFTCPAHPNYFSKLDAAGFTINLTAAQNPSHWPLEVEIAVSNGLGRIVLGTAYICYSFNGAKQTTINKKISVYTGNTA